MAVMEHFADIYCLTFKSKVVYGINQRRSRFRNLSLHIYNGWVHSEIHSSHPNLHDYKRLLTLALSV